MGKFGSKAFQEGIKLAKQYYDDGLSNHHYIPEGKDISADFFAGKEYEQWTRFARDDIRKQFCPDIISDCLWTVLTMSEYHDSNCKLLPWNKSRGCSVSVHLTQLCKPPLQLPPLT